MGTFGKDNLWRERPGESGRGARRRGHAAHHGNKGKGSLLQPGLQFPSYLAQVEQTELFKLVWAQQPGMGLKHLWRRGRQQVCVCVCGGGGGGGGYQLELKNWSVCW